MIKESIIQVSKKGFIRFEDLTGQTVSFIQNGGSPIIDKSEVDKGWYIFIDEYTQDHIEHMPEELKDLISYSEENAIDTLHFRWEA